MTRRPACLLLGVLLLTACGEQEPVTPSPEAPRKSQPFTDVAAAMGIDFVHRNGGSGRKYLVETNGSGAAWLDADGDGALDLYLVQGASLPGWEGEEELRNALYLRRGERFVDETEAAGVGDGGHGMAAAAADVDGDGDADLFVTNWGRNTFYRNGGAARFEEQTAAAGLAASEDYHSSCLFGDLDLDGDLDLYVVGYVDWSLDKNPSCGRPELGPAYLSYCHPDMFHGVDDLLYRNDGDARFTDVSEAAGLRGSAGKGLGVTGGDFDQDGDLDLFVANDSNENHLWRNEGELRFVDAAAEWGVAFNGDGATEACMGCDLADVDGDLDLDLFTVNLSGETNTLWTWEGRGFRDRSFASGLAGRSEPYVGFGTRIADYDLDGLPDVAVANGHVLDNAELFDRTHRHRQPSMLFRGVAAGKFQAVPADELGADFVGPRVGRALAAADFDDDGDLDLLITANGGAPALLRNDFAEGRHWIGFALVDEAATTVGSILTLRAGERRQRLQASPGSSYLSAHDPRLLFGLGDFSGPVQLELRWPDGEVQELGDLEVDRYHTLRRAR